MSRFGAIDQGNWVTNKKERGNSSKFTLSVIYPKTKFVKRHKSIEIIALICPITNVKVSRKVIFMWEAKEM